MTEQHVRDDVWYKCTRKQLYGVCEPGMGAVYVGPAKRTCMGYKFIGDKICRLDVGHDGPHQDEGTSWESEGQQWSM